MSAPRLRGDLDRFPVYRPGRPAPAGPGRTYKLSSNESPLGPLPSVRDAIAEAASRAHLYPDWTAAALVATLAERHGVEEGRVVVGSGSSEVLSQLIRAVAGPGDEVVYAWRSFEAYPSLVVAAGATPVQVPLAQGGRHDMPALAAAVTPATRLVMVCSPNNPTGTTVTHEEMVALLEAVPTDVAVLLDEAYCEFDRSEDGPRADALLAAYPHLVVARTFSKAWGLAGMRIGYGVAPLGLAAAMRRMAIAFGVTGLAQAAALASLEAEGELAERVADVVAQRDRLVAALRGQGWDVPDAQGNFVWVAAGDSTDALGRVLYDNGISAREFEGEGVRITVGSSDATDAVIAACALAATAPAG
ncbi:histidinol-phosphate transaminase [Demequina sp. NBRC 110054]|uniref:histidinol-phosphate transaminase n=1 Tax=Demequina sp. NBRC 110054 TaxID=1570343 RepID=UPI001F02C1D2|nr:histidinol-phosphate transaminase [Demequina sp. NBRC 110054]